jgi:hypothetical protein
MSKMSKKIVTRVVKLVKMKRQKTQQRTPASPLCKIDCQQAELREKNVNTKWTGAEKGLHEDPGQYQKRPDPENRVFVQTPLSQFCPDGTRPTPDFQKFVRTP